MGTKCKYKGENMLNVSNNLSSCCPKPQIALAHNNNKFATKSIAFQAAAPSAAGSSFMNKAADFLKDIAKRAGDKIKEVAIDNKPIIF